MPRRPSPRATTPIGLTMLALVLLFAWLSWKAEGADRMTQMRTVAELTEKATDRYFVQKQRALGALADDILDGSGLADLQRAQRLLGRFKSLHEELLAVSLLALDGQFLATSATTQLQGLPSTASQRNYAEILARLKPGEPMELSPPLLGPVTKRWILPLRYTVRDGSGAPVAFLVASVPAEMLQSFWSDAPVVEQASIALVRDDGHLISRYPLPDHTSNEQVYGKPRSGAVISHLKAHGFPARGQIEGENTLAGEPYASAFVRLESFPVTVIAGMPVASIRAAWWQRTRGPLLLAVALALAGLGMFHAMSRRERAWQSERLEAEARLKASESFLERTGQLAGVGGWSVDLRTQAVAWSAHTYRIHEVEPGYRPAVETGIAFYAEEARAQVQAAIERGRVHGTPWDLELPFTTARGRAIWVRLLGSVEFEADVPVRLVGAIQDVTEYRERRMALQAEQLLRQQAEQQTLALSELLDERGRMLDVLAHEVRQPLHNASAALQSATGVLREQGERDASARLSRAHAVLSQVTGSIDNTLAVAALLARPDPIRREDVDIGTLLAMVVADLATEQRGRIVIDRQTSTRTASLDMSLVRLALRNLVVNALRHSPPGASVTVAVQDSDDPLALLIDVINHGPAVDEALEGRLFERGARGSTGAGHGLGLYIVRRVMELHDGSAALLHNEAGLVTFRLVFEQPIAD